VKRIYHHWNDWECVPAGMYETTCALSDDEAKDACASFLRDSERFKKGLRRVLTEWPISCEQFLSNESINRIAWLGQSAMCIETGIPSQFKGGFKRLSPAEQKTANALADRYLKLWIRNANQSPSVHRGVEETRLSTGHIGRGSFGPYEFATCALLQSDLFRHLEE
jgi:hypothetical protein